MKRSLLAFAVLCASCVHSGFTPTAGLRVPPRPEGCYVDVILEGEPTLPYVVLGRATTEGTAPGLFALGENEEVALHRLMDQACAAGGHFLLRVDTGSNGQWTRDGYSRATRGAAVVGIYTTPEGRPLPPPAGPVVRVNMPRNGASAQVAAPPPPVSPAPPAAPPQ